MAIEENADAAAQEQPPASTLQQSVICSGLDWVLNVP